MRESVMVEIKLSDLTRDGEVRNLSGHERGVAAREKFNLPNLDSAPETVVVVVPDDITTLTSSFFQGMFSESVQSLGNDRDRFLNHYQFDASPLVLMQIERGIAAVQSRTKSKLIS